MADCERKRVRVNSFGYAVGEDHQHAILSDDDIRLMLAVYGELDSDGKRIGYGTVASKFGCSKSTARDIIRGRIRQQQATGTAVHKRQLVFTPADEAEFNRED